VDARTARRFVEGYFQHRFAWLFATLMLAIGVQPLVQTVVPGVNLLGPLLALSLFAAIASAARQRTFRFLIGLGAGWILLRALRQAIGGDTVAFLGEAVWVAACLLATGATARQALRGRAVDSERIFAALDAYLMAGLLFGVCYWTLEFHLPESFGAAATRDLAPQAAIYFSFVTLATLGYGDIVPVSGAARGLAILEAVSGQIYMAVLLARLVSLYTMRERT
jgi:hypothetical protein